MQRNLQSKIQTLKSWDRGYVVLIILWLLLLPAVSTRIYASDEIKYYSYLPSLYFDGDLEFRNQFNDFYEMDRTKWQAFKEGVIDKPDERGRLVNEAPIGSAMLWSPFYVATDLGLRAGQAVGLFKNAKLDGYSKPYIQAVCYASNLLGFLGLLLGYRLCRRYFALWASLLATLLAWFATPAFFYMYIAPPWSHAASLFAVALFITFWQDSALAGSDRSRSEDEAVANQPDPTPIYNLQSTIYNRRLWQYAVLGLLGGVMMTVREQDGLFMLIPAVEGVALLTLFLRGRDWRSVGRLVAGNALFLVGVIVGFLPQIYAYYQTNGTFGPSKRVAEKFNWLSPNFFSVLFDAAHGMIPWTPVVALGLVGLAVLWRYNRLLAAAFALAVLAEVFVAGAFSTWMGAGSFGQRRFVNITLILAVALAALASYLHAKKLPRWSLITVAVLLIAWNAGLVINYALWLSPQRQGLDWARVWQDQTALLNPGYTFDKLRRFIFDRGGFYRN